MLPAVWLEKKKQMWLATGSGICQRGRERGVGRERERERELAPTDIGQIRAWPIVLFWPYAMPHTGCQSVLLFPLLLSTLSISDRLPLPLGQLLIDGRSQLPPFPYLTEVRQKLRLLVWHIDALRLRRLRLEAVQAAA